MQGYWVCLFYVDLSNLDWNSEGRMSDLSSELPAQGWCWNSQPGPRYTEFIPSPLCPHLPAAQFLPPQTTDSVKASAASLHYWFSVLEYAFILIKKKLKVTQLVHSHFTGLNFCLNLNYLI